MKKLILLLFFTAISGATLLTAQKTAADDFYETDKIREVRIRFKQSNWKEILDSLKMNGSESLLGTASIGAKEYKNVGVRYHGHKAFTTGGDRNSLQIKLNHINKKQNHKGYKRIKLSNSLRDPSMVREVLGFEIARKYMHAPKANYARLYINGEYRGVFANIEHISDKFLEEHFGDSENTFFSSSRPMEESNEDGCKKKVSGTLVYEEDASCYMNNYELKSEDGWDDLIQLTDVLSNNPKEVGKMLNVDQVLWMHAFNNVLVNLNSYAGDYSENYYLYKDRFGRFTPVVRDLNLCFGSYKNIKFRGSSLSLEELQNMDPLLHSGNASKPLISKLLEDPYNKKLYISHVKRILADNFLDGQYEERAKELQRLISNDMFRDKYKYYEHNQFLGSLENTTGKKSKIPGIVELMSKRTRFLKKHKEVRGFGPEIFNVEVLWREKFKDEKVTSFHIRASMDNRPKKARLFYRFSSDEDFKVAFMYDDGRHHDKAAGDKVFGVEVKPDEGKTKIEYYIQAENAIGIMHSPKDYITNLHRSSLEELNK